MGEYGAVSSSSCAAGQKERWLRSHPPQFLLATLCKDSVDYRQISGSKKSLVAHPCHDAEGSTIGVRSGQRPQISFLLLVKLPSKEPHVFKTLARVPESSKYRIAI